MNPDDGLQDAAMNYWTTLRSLIDENVGDGIVEAVARHEQAHKLLILCACEYGKWRDKNWNEVCDEHQS